MTILVIAEHDNTVLKPATLNTVTAAKYIGGEIHLLIAGFNCQAVADAATRIDGVSQVLLSEHKQYEHPIAENLAKFIIKLSKDYSYIIAPSTTIGKDVLPRVAAVLDVAQISDITAVKAPDTFQRPIYAGNAIATVQSLDPIKVITVRTTAFDPSGHTGCAEILITPPLQNDSATEFIKEEIVRSDRPDLTSANIVVSGGRGLENSENFTLLEQLADQLGAAVGASRAAVDSGFATNDKQVGQTGKIVAPKLYIAIGISGAIQHLAGMKDSKTIIAINKDEEAPIFSVADYGLVADLSEVLPQLQENL